jgi:NitT/TauT family transport system substrate-binding protein
MVAANREFARNYPVATKRALRAFLKANELCSLDPQGSARLLVEKGYESNYSYALQTLQDIPYGTWRNYDPEDTLRFYSLRFRDAGMIRNTPQDIIVKGTDWRFLNELRQELKA